jgi:UDP-GlcNAc:undecaprenyl-phosphate GlcNAc-1-phosphate transferase
MQVILPVVVGLAVAATVMIGFRPLASRIGLVDVPGGRKTHVGEVPVIGGIAIYVACLIVALAFGGGEVTSRAELLAAAGMMVVVGAFDDRFDLPPNTRIVAHLVAAITLVLGSGCTVRGLGDLLGFGYIGLGPFDFLFTVIATIALIHAFNMLDGLDGIAGGIALIALAGLSSHLASVDAAAGVIALGLLGAVAGFLIFNVPAAFNRRVLAFMGDAGSTLLGFSLAGLSLVAIQPGEEALPPALVLWLLPVPIIELFTSTIRRAVTGLSPLQADRGHFHHKLLDAGFSVRAIFIMYLGVSSCSAVIGLLAWKAGASDALLFYTFLAMSLVWLAATHNAKRLTPLLPEALKRGEWPRRTREVTAADAPHMLPDRQLETE